MSPAESNSELLGRDGETPAAAMTDPGLTAKLLADQEALANDLAQAQELAADFRRVAADKTNEVAHLKRLLEQVQSDLARYEQHIAELRQERHRLANEAMRVTDLEIQLGDLAAENARIKKENAALRQAWAAKNGGGASPQIEELARTVRRLQDMVEQRGEVPGPAKRRGGPPPADDPDFIDISFDR
jgi:chromosome segregation ATPase